MKTKIMAATLILSSSANAAILTFDDRATFEAYVGGVTIDTLEDMSSSWYGSLDRGDYTYDGSAYGCTNSLACGDNSNQGFSYNYASLYGAGNFVFDIPVNAFGMDFGIYDGSNYGIGLETTIYLNGYSRTVTAVDENSFFGIVDTTNNLGSIAYSREQIIYGGTPTSSGGIIDNVTYGSVSAVPVPAAVWLLASGLIGIAGLARRKHA